MQNAIHLVLDPVPRPEATGPGARPVTITGMKIRFFPHGDGPSKAKKDAWQPASIEFVGRLRKSLRNAPELLEKPLGELAGQIQFRGKTDQVIFACDADSLKKLVGIDDEEAPSEQEEEALRRLRVLDLILPKETFTGTESLVGVPQLRLPPETAKYAYLDVHAKLSIGGAVETGLDDNDVLDVPVWRESPPKIRGYDVLVVDEVSEPIGGVTLQFTFDNRKVERVTSTKTGKAFVASTSRSVANVQVQKPETVSEELKARWAKVRSQLGAPAGEDVLIRSLPQLSQAFDVKAGMLQTLSIQPGKKRASLFEFHDTLFRTASCVVLPEGEAPTETGEHEAISSAGLIASILRYNEENPGNKFFIAGHTDREAWAAYNQDLSDQRAQVVLAMLMGDRDSFIKLCDARRNYAGPDKIDVDITQIFDWTTSAFGFTCKPTDLTRTPSPTRYQQFRTSFNEWVDTEKPQIGPDAHTPPKLAPTGTMDKTIWGAIFDLYEFNLQGELGEKPADVQKLRDDIKWVDDSKRWLGFGERHPTKENTPDGMVSQADRRVEVMFFEEGEEPNLVAKKGEDVYDGVTFERRRLKPMANALRHFEWYALHLLDSRGKEMKGTPFRISLDSEVMHGIAHTSWVKIRLPIGSSPNGKAEWGSPDASGRFPYTLGIEWNCRQGSLSEPEEARNKLTNLGYSRTAPFDSIVRYFQSDHGLPVTGCDANGNVPPETMSELRRVYDEQKRQYEAL